MSRWAFAELAIRKMDGLIDQTIENENSSPWLLRVAMAAESWARPMWGWGVLLACMLISLLPAVALRANRWLVLGSFQQILEMVGPLAVITVWALWGWRRQERQRFGWLAALATVVLGAVVVSQLLLGWLPGLSTLWQAVQSGDLMLPIRQSSAEWTQAVTRFTLWAAGVATGGAAQDNLVFATFGSVILWLVGVLTAWLARRTQQGFAAAVPALWLLGSILLYSSAGRYLLLVGLALTIVLHILLDQGVLAARWKRLRLDYSSSLLVDRMVTVLSAGIFILTVAAIMPNLYVEPLVMGYYNLLAPFNASVEDLGERLFPELRGTSRLRGGSGTGLPNEFLLQGGPNVGTAVVMRVRTDEAPSYQLPYDEMAPPPSHYMRGGTLALYDGKGWRNPDEMERQEVVANQQWDGSSEWGRKPVVQSVILAVSSSTLYAAPEPVEVSVDARLDVRGVDDQVALRGGDQSYTVVSMVPAVDEVMLRQLPAWGDDNPLPERLGTHLLLPESITERTRELTEQVTTDQATMYDKALAIEQYLRQYEYDLEVPEPPVDVDDVADYFLFDLQRGYCDYYATAFVVMARLSGLPTRFATGFAVGQWDPIEGVWIITEAQAHSWPEVYFPQVGWIAFEPTAGRSTLVRTALPQQSSLGVLPPAVAIPESTEESRETIWNWQMLLWLLPVVGVAWALVMGWRWWQQRREDPWNSVLQWGRRAGRPMNAGETVLEYGRELAGFVLQRQTRSSDAGRMAAREIQAVSEEVNTVRYGRADERMAALQAVEQRWARLRSYLGLVRFS
jgi:transglutaminase-like putative cysteine protease